MPPAVDGKATIMNTRMRPALLLSVVGASLGATLPLQRLLAAATATRLDDAEIRALQFIREEEKLARDVYRAMATRHQTRVFSSIALAEQRHMDSVATLLTTYAIPDPVAENPDGVFTDPTLQALYTTLVARGDRSLAEALLVGALIEETDIDDLGHAALANVPAADIARVIASLHDGSIRHLRAFVANWERRTGSRYLAQALPAAELDEALGR